MTSEDAGPGDDGDAKASEQLRDGASVRSGRGVAFDVL
jgi:hypothetical protein